MIQRLSKSTAFILGNHLENNCYKAGCKKIEVDKELGCRRDSWVKGDAFLPLN